MIAHFFPLFSKILPLYMSITLGYIATKALDTNRDTIARLMFFLINPIIIFNGLLKVKLEPSTLTLPLLSFVIASTLCLLFYRFSRGLWNDSSRNVLAFSAGTGNTGYFGIPLALLLLNDEGEGIYILSLLGITIFENTLGYYILAKHAHPRFCFQKLIKLPAIYAFVTGLLINWSGIPMPEAFTEFMYQVKGTFTVLGMMIIGLGLARISSLNMDKLFIGLSFFAKFFAWPFIILVLIVLDRFIFGIYSPLVHKALILLSIVPLAPNTVILSSLLNSQPDKAATAVFMSTIFALFYVPIMVSFFIVPN
jgi:predicted permease